MNLGFGLIIIFSFAAFIAIRFMLARQWAVNMSRTLGLPNESPVMTLTGEYMGPNQVRRRGVRITAQLDLFDWGIRLHGTQSRWDPVWEVRYGELAAAQAVKSILLPVVGVRFNPGAGVAMPMIFWTDRYGDVLDHLEQHGVRVQRSMARLGSLWSSGVR